MPTPPSRLTPETTPLRLDLKRDEKLSITWQDGTTSVYSLALLRTMCPCAQCRTVRNGKPENGAMPVKKPTSLNVLPGNFAQPLTVLSAELVGNYALKLDWSDNHSSGIYSFQYLRDIDPGK